MQPWSLQFKLQTEKDASSFCLGLVFSCSLGQQCRREDVLTYLRLDRREFVGARISKIAEVNAPRRDVTEFEDLELLQIVKSRLTCEAIERNDRTRISAPKNAHMM